jgi:hypothetical protein
VDANAPGENKAAVSHVVVVAPSYFNEIGVLRLEQNGPPPSVPCAYTATCKTRCEVVTLDYASVVATMDQVPRLWRSYELFRTTYKETLHPTKTRGLQQSAFSLGWDASLSSSMVPFPASSLRSDNGDSTAGTEYGLDRQPSAVDF